MVGGFVSTLFSLGALVIFAISYEGSLFLWCIDNPAYTKSNCVARVPSGGYFASSDFFWTIGMFVISYGTVILFYIYLKEKENKSLASFAACPEGSS